MANFQINQQIKIKRFKIWKIWGQPTWIGIQYMYSWSSVSGGLFTFDWAEVKEDPSLLFLFLSLSMGATFWVTCSPSSSLSTTDEESVLSFWVTQGSLSLRVTFELCWRDVLSWTLASAGTSWRDSEGKNWEKQVVVFPSSIKPDILMGVLGKKTESRRKGGCWYEKAAILRASKIENGSLQENDGGEAKACSQVKWVWDNLRGRVYIKMREEREGTQSITHPHAKLLYIWLVLSHSLSPPKVRD